MVADIEGAGNVGRVRNPCSSTYLRNIQDILSDGKTPYERRFGQPFKRPIFHVLHWLSITL